jgi:hypothetical protein
MYVLQSCNACTIEKLSCVYLATHVRCGGTGTAIVLALQGDGRISRAYIGCLHRLKYGISRLYPKAEKIMALIRPQRLRFAPLPQHHRDADIIQPAHRHCYTMARCWTGPTTAARLKCNRTVIAQRPCFHLTAILQISCSLTIIFKLKSSRTMSGVMWLRGKIFWIAVRWHFAGWQLPVAAFPVKNRAGAAYLCDWDLI